ncbi:MAG: heparinase II/III family protein [Bacteroidales bacterium]|nr:heparinase II/III family protein [Bacteroidales bacterium]MCF8390700.1 heparinase II/III family protein [Bacteroidales bacterium]
MNNKTLIKSNLLLRHPGTIIFAFFLLLTVSVIGQEIPSNKVLKPSELASFLNEDVKNLLTENSSITQESLASYLRDKFSERYYYDWKNFEARFALYNQLYDDRQNDHALNAIDHMTKFSDSTQWLLPFNYLNGEAVDAYAIRHLARQHKMVDIAFHYFYEQKNPVYIEYFVNQQESLNAALESGKYEKTEDGNGVYEVFRSGYRAYNWLLIHNLFLGQEKYTDENQLTCIATLLQQGAHLFEDNQEFQSGNHQTKGMSSLAMISILLRDFKDTDKWLDQALKLLEEHLTMEINPDGFQFERSVHYHMSDIINYYNVYQLAKISGISLDKFWEEKLHSLFATLVKIAYPDKSAPVLQDDTANPWAEKNDISGALTMGYLLFEDPVFGYFANDKVESAMYWYLSDLQLNSLKNIKKEKPEYHSLAFPSTGYYVMREGWEKDDNMMIISAGLDDKKPDHQHGDMLGVQAMSKGNVILPNYQVRYNLKDYDFFKNSMVKNVALVDDELQGKEWTGNQGGSGFGKFKNLPVPKTIAWKTNKDLDLFVGSHDGFKNIGVAYTRQVIYVKNDFWIVKDNFKSKEPHVYKQIWQGHFTNENQTQLIRSTFDDGSGCDIYQLKATTSATTNGTQGKEWTIISKKDSEEFNFISLIYPFSEYSNRIEEDTEFPDLNGWRANKSKFKIEGNEPVSLSKDDCSFIFGVKKISINNFRIELSEPGDLYLKMEDSILRIQHIGDSQADLIIEGGSENTLNGYPFNNKIVMNPGDVLLSKINME